MSSEQVLVRVVEVAGAAKAADNSVSRRVVPAECSCTFHRFVMQSDISEPCTHHYSPVVVELLQISLEIAQARVPF